MTCPTLGNSCATVDQLLAVAPEFEIFGGVSSGTITLIDTTVDGDILTIGDVVLTGVTGGVLAPNQWDVDGTITEQCNSIIAAIMGGELASYVTAEKVFGSPVIKVSSLAEGKNSEYPWSTSTAAIELSAPTLEGGACDIGFYLKIACSMLNKHCWGNKVLPASIYIAAHLMTVASAGDNGVATSRGISAISEGYSYIAPTGPTDPYWNNTVWGRLYLALWQTIPKFPVVSGGLYPRAWCGGYRGRCR